MAKILEGKRALVTGSSRGIGAAIARSLAAAGARVVVHGSKSAEAARAVAEEIRHHGGVAEIAREDLSASGGAARLIRASFELLGGLDILVNNAAVFQTAPVEEILEDDIDRLLALNVRAVLAATGEFVRLHPGKVDGGRIVNISSMAGRNPSGGSSLYAASKAALEAMTRSHAIELGRRGITVNAVAPGTTETEMFGAGFPREARAAIERGTALGRIGQPEEIASVVCFLCSSGAGWVTGQTLGVDGGMFTGAGNLVRLGT